ncbi:MAG: hypothetical protein J6W16_06750 [Methanobrevibacter sp.]|nr:hypothetical protein [Methanobrevibacter sp.]MBP5785262.1 hypothetical protein [Methanobrevibacter sp.]
MGNLEEAFNNTMNDLCRIDWSETDGSDVRMVLKTNFAGFLPERKDEIMTMFDSASGLNKFQKMLIKDKLMNL